MATLGQPAEGTVFGVRNSRMESIQPEGAAEGATYEVQPDLPTGVSMSASGVIYGTPTEVMTRTQFTVWANQTDGTSVESVFWLEVLEDTDGDGLPDELPDDYDDSDGGLVQDEDDDNDGITDLDEAALGIDPSNPDTDGDGICDGLESFPPTCLAGPDSNPSGRSTPRRSSWSTTPRWRARSRPRTTSRTPRGRSPPTCRWAWRSTPRPG